MNLPAFAVRHKKSPYALQLKTIFAEFIGTFLLTFFAIAGALVLLSQDVFFNQLFSCFYIGILTFLGIFCCYTISGSHFNPAISLGFFIANRISFQKFIAYLSTQIAGGVLATFFVFYLFSNNKDAVSSLLSKSPTLNNPQGLMLSSICQSVMMFMVLLLFLGLTYLKKDKLYIAAFMAMAVFMASFVNISITNYPLNPAITVGELLIFGDYGIIDGFILWISPFAGACMAGIIYYITFIKPVN